MFYGLDVHKRFTQVCAVDRAGHTSREFDDLGVEGKRMIGIRSLGARGVLTVFVLSALTAPAAAAPSGPPVRSAARSR